MRLRISETYTDAARYKTEGGVLVWDRAFGRPRNTVVLPAAAGYLLMREQPALAADLLPKVMIERADAGEAVGQATGDGDRGVGEGGRRGEPVGRADVGPDRRGVVTPAF